MNTQIDYYECTERSWTTCWGWGWRVAREGFLEKVNQSWALKDEWDLPGKADKEDREKERTVKAEDTAEAGPRDVNQHSVGTEVQALWLNGKPECKEDAVRIKGADRRRHVVSRRSHYRSVCP